MSEQTGVPAHYFHDIYDRSAPWDVKQHQPAVAALADEGVFRGEVLDVGCGTGDNAIFLAGRGFPVTAIDFVPQALAIAQERAAAAGVRVDFRLQDVLALSSWDRQFDTVLDSAVLHVFGDADRQRLIEGLRHVTKPGGTLVVLCFSDAMPAVAGGPRSLSAAEIRAAFADGWQIHRLEACRFRIAVGPGDAPAWQVVLQRTT